MQTNYTGRPLRSQYADIEPYFDKLQQWWVRIAELRLAIDKEPAGSVILRVAAFSTEVERAFQMAPGLPKELQQVAQLFERLVSDKATEEFPLSR